MKLDKRMIAAFLLTSSVIAGTALASFGTTTTQSIDSGSLAQTLTKAPTRTNEPVVVITPIPATIPPDPAIAANHIALVDDKDEYNDGKYKYKEPKKDHKEKGNGNPHKKNNGKE